MFITDPGTRGQSILLLNIKENSNPTDVLKSLPSVTRLSEYFLTRGFAPPLHNGFAISGRSSRLFMCDYRISCNTLSFIAALLFKLACIS